MFALRWALAVGRGLGLTLGRMSEPHDGQELEADLHFDLPLLGHDREIVLGGKTGKSWFFLRLNHHQLRARISGFVSLQRI